MAAVKTKALVIREQDFSEQDKLLTLFTETEGKQKAIARGVRRTKSPLTSATQLFSYGEYVYYPGKNFASINQAALIESYYPLRQDMGKMMIGSCVLELLDVFFDFYQGNPALLKVAVHLLYYISKSLCADDAAMLAAFQMKCVRSQGIMPVLTECAHCHGTEDLMYFGIEDGGVMCRLCANDYGMTYRLLPGQAELMAHLMREPVKALKAEQFDSGLIIAVCDLMARYIAMNTGKKLSAYGFYKDFRNEEKQLWQSSI